LFDDTAILVAGVATALALAYGIWYFIVCAKRSAGDGKACLDDSAYLDADADTQGEPEHFAMNTPMSSCSSVGLDMVPEWTSRQRDEEKVYENAPTPSQTWDMSASYRGAEGGVQQRVEQFEKGEGEAVDQ